MKKKTSKAIRFTKAVIDALTAPKAGRDVYKDTEARHLRLFVTATAKTFYLVKKIHGKVAFVKIGRHPELTISEARAQTAEAGARLAKGEDTRRPVADKMLFGELFARYMAEFVMPHKKRSWKEQQRMHDVLFPSWDKRAIKDISHDMVSVLHRRIGTERGEYQANRVLGLIRRVFNFGINGIQIKMDNPARGVEMFDEKSRERYMAGDELARFFTALNDEQTPVVWRDFFALALWTGARRSNVQAMRWQDVDMGTATWTIPGEQSKNGDQLRVVLSTAALDILRQRKATTGKSDYVFPARGKTGHIVSPKNAWRDILALAGIANLRIHDLRRTFGSWQAATGASLLVIGKTLGHKNQKTTEVYSRLNLDPVRASVDKATAAMVAAINGQAKPEVAQ
jgi:integrase